MKHIFLVLVAGLISQTAWAGWVVTYAEAESGERSQEYYEKGKANFGQLIYTGKHMLVVDPDAKAYWKGTPNQYCEALKAQKKKMEAQMAAMPAQYRPVPISKRKVTRKKIGTQKIAGYSATGYEFYVDGDQEGQVWVSSDSGLSGIIDFERSMAKKMKCFEGLDSASVEGSALYKQTTEGTFTLKESYREVVSVEKKSVPSSHFEAPAGYKSFDDYDKFMNYLMNHSRSSSRSSSGQSAMPYEAPTRQQSSQSTSSTQTGAQSQQKDNVIVKDAKDIASDTVDEAHQETKEGIQDEISKDVKKGVKNMLDKLF